MYSQLTPHKMHLKITTTTTILAITLVVGAAAAALSTQQIAQAITIEEGIQLINQGADELEPHSSDAADRLRAAATQIGGDGGVGCSEWDPRC
jgi:hypothetical protein